MKNKSNGICRLLLITIGLVIAFFAQLVRADDPLFYAVTGVGEFGTLDPITGTFAPITKLTLIPGSPVVGLGFAADGNLYGIGYSGLYEINQNSGAVNVLSISPSGVFLHPNGLGLTASPNGTLYAYGTKGLTSLYTLLPNGSVAAPTLIGNMGYGLGGGFASDQTGNLYITKGLGTEQLFSVNPTTGSAAFIGNTGTPASYAMAFASNTLYMADLHGGIWTVDTSTGAATQVSSYNGSFGAIEALAPFEPQVVPEPAQLKLALVGILLPWLVQRKIRSASSLSGR
jgi:hypothetical protein